MISVRPFFALIQSLVFLFPSIDLLSQETGSDKQSFQLGQVELGISAINTDEDSETVSGDLEVGYVFKIKTKDIIPWELEWQPFYINRLRKTAEEIDPQAGAGVGWELALGKESSRWRWVLRNTWLVPETDYIGQDFREEPELALMIGARYEFGGPDTYAIERLKQVPRFVRHSLDLRGFDSKTIRENKEFEKIISVGLMSSYFVQVLGNEGLLRIAYASSSELRLKAFIEYLEARDLTSEEDRLLESSDLDDADEIYELIETSLGHFLLEAMRKRYPFEINISFENQISWIRVVSRSRHKSLQGVNSLFLDEDRMFSYFLEAMVERVLEENRRS